MKGILMIRLMSRFFEFYDSIIEVCRRNIFGIKWPETTRCLFIGCLFALSLIPLLWISCYNYPSADDYCYGRLTHTAWSQTSSIWSVLEVAFRVVCMRYMDWQGTYSAIFLMNLQPAIFGGCFYRFVPFVMLSALIVSSLYLWKVILVDWLKSDTFSWLLVALCSLYMSIQYLPSPVEGFYWYNGSVYYTFYYSCALLYYVVLLKSVNGNRRPGKGRCLFLFLFSLFLAGGNLVTALLSQLLLVVLYLYVVYRKKRTFIVLFCLFVFAAGLAVSVMAPGNAVRQAYCQNAPVLKTVLVSFYDAYSLIVKVYTTVPVLIVLSMLVLPLYKTVSVTNYSFKRPGLFLCLSFCFFSSQLAPHYYAASCQGPGRLMNIVYYSYWWFMILNLIYILGWLSHQIKQKPGVSDSLRELYTRLRPYRAMGFSILLLSLFYLNISDNTTSRSAGKSLLKGEAARYGDEMAERIRRYEGDEKIVGVKKLSATPEVLVWKEVRTDSCFWVNRGIAYYYDKISIYLIE